MKKRNQQRNAFVLYTRLPKKTKNISLRMLVFINLIKIQQSSLVFDLFCCDQIRKFELLFPTFTNFPALSQSDFVVSGEFIPEFPAS